MNGLIIDKKYIVCCCFCVRVREGVYQEDTVKDLTKVFYLMKI